MSWSLAQVRSLKAANANVPRDLELEAIWEEITTGWSEADIVATAEGGMSDADRVALEEIIRDEGLAVDADEAAEWFVERCWEHGRDG